MLNTSDFAMFTRAAAVDLSTTDATYASGQYQALYIGGAGDVKVDITEPYGVVGGAPVVSTVTYKAVPVGWTLPMNVTKVYKTGTTATNLLALG